MKKIYVILIVVLALALIGIVWTIGRGGDAADEPQTTQALTTPQMVTNTPETQETAAPAPTATTAPTPTPTPTPEPTPTAKPASIAVYALDGDGDFTWKAVRVDDLTAEAVAQELTKAGVLSASVTALSAELSDDKYYGALLELDMSASFQTQLTTASAGGGTYDEYGLLGCVANTYLMAFGADTVRITAGGSNLVTDGNYGSFLTMFSDDGRPEQEPVETPALTTAEAIVKLAKSLVDAPYKYGTAGPDTFDNSGFVYYCFTQNGVTVPRVTTEQFSDGTAVGEGELLPGDLVFFSYSEDRSASYVGIYLGDGKFIAENNEDSPVKIQDMTTSYFTEKYVGARRYF